MKCPKCGNDEQIEITVDQDRMGNDLHAIACANEDCDHIFDQQDEAGQCLHWNVEVDQIGRGWCLECGNYMGERW